jgi:hypothetical protein
VPISVGWTSQVSLESSIGPPNANPNGTASASRSLTSLTFGPKPRTFTPMPGWSPSLSVMT